MDYNQEVRKLKYLVEYEFKLNDNELDDKSREGVMPIARLIYGNLIMNELNLKPSLAARHLNRDRSLFYYYIKLHKNYINDARIYPEYYNHYMNIKNKYYDMSDAVLQAKTEERKHQLLYDIECNIDKLERERKLIIESFIEC